MPLVQVLFQPFLRQVSGRERNRGSETLEETDSKRSDMNLALVFGEAGFSAKVFNSFHIPKM